MDERDGRSNEQDASERADGLEIVVLDDGCNKKGLLGWNRIRRDEGALAGGLGKDWFNLNWQECWTSFAALASIWSYCRCFCVSWELWFGEQAYFRSGVTGLGLLEPGRGEAETKRLENTKWCNDATDAYGIVTKTLLKRTCTIHGWNWRTNCFALLAWFKRRRGADTKLVGKDRG